MPDACANSWYTHAFPETATTAYLHCRPTAEGDMALRADIEQHDVNVDDARLWCLAMRRSSQCGPRPYYDGAGFGGGGRGASEYLEEGRVALLQACAGRSCPAPHATERSAPCRWHQSRGRSDSSDARLVMAERGRHCPAGVGHLRLRWVRDPPYCVERDQAPHACAASPPQPAAPGQRLCVHHGRHLPHALRRRHDAEQSVLNSWGLVLRSHGSWLTLDSHQSDQGLHGQHACFAGDRFVTGSKS